MSKDLDPERLKKELINLYDSFVRNPKHFKEKDKARDLYLRYDHAAFYLLKEPLNNAVGYLFSLFRYGDDDHYESRDEIEERAKKIYQSLK